VTLLLSSNRDGHPLMPCTPAKARKLLRAGRASVVKRCPFTIQLSWQCEGCVQEVRAGIGKGSHITGICCVGNGKALFSAEIHHRKDVKDRMDDRRVRRRARRSRKRYRPPLSCHLPYGGMGSGVNNHCLCDPVSSPTNAQAVSQFAPKRKRASALSGVRRTQRL